MSKGRVGLVLLALMAAASATVAAAGPVSARTRSYDLENVAATSFEGGAKVAPAGDVNGDGIPDLLVSEANTVSFYDSVYVVFGDSAQTDIDLRDLGERGFAINGAESLGPPDAEGLGDVNGDGLGDIVVGASEANRAYVVFGKASTTPVNLLAFDAYAQADQGFRIDGAGSRSLTGEYVAAAGDVNGDGLADVLVAAPFAKALYVVFGKSDFLPVSLAAFHNGTQGDAGYLIKTTLPPEASLYSLSFAGDVNGDGRPDAAVAVLKPSEPRKRGAWIVFGKPDNRPVDVMALGDKGIWIRGYISVIAGAGDANGDGFDDVVVDAGDNSYVVFGRRRPGIIRTRYLGHQGFAIRPKTIFGFDGTYSSLGDVNRDGLDDILIGGWLDENRGRAESGSAYVIFGKKGSRLVDAADLRWNGYRIDGPEGTGTGDAVAGPGDINGDGIPDLFIGASGAFRKSDDEYGGAFLVWGHG